jgi:hypothetical protein
MTTAVYMAPVRTPTKLNLKTVDDLLGAMGDEDEDAETPPTARRKDRSVDDLTDAVDDEDAGGARGNGNPGNLSNLRDRLVSAFGGGDLLCLWQSTVRLQVSTLILCLLVDSNDCTDSFDSIIRFTYRRT